MRKGQRHSAEARERIRRVRLGQERSEDSLKKQGSTMAALWADPEWRAKTLAARAKVGAWNKGLKTGPQSEELRARKAKKMRRQWRENREKRFAMAVQGGAVRRERHGETYAGVYQRMREWERRGLLEKGTCRKVGCEDPATQWACLHGTETHVGDRPHGLRCGYSIRPEDYVGLCRKHHLEYDKKHLTKKEQREIARRRNAGELASMLAKEFDVTMRRVERITAKFNALTEKKEEDRMNKKSTKSTGFTLIELMIVVAIIGILASIAIPSFLRNARKAKTTEATINVKKILDGAVAYYHGEMNAPGTATPIAKQFPSAAATPVEPALGTCCAAPSGSKCAPDATLWTDPTWQALAFAMDDPHYYSYGYVRNAAGAAGVGAPTVAGGGAVTEWFYADAMGDLNCDGAYSTFEMLGAVVPGDGSITTGAGLFKSAELE